ncbi:MAG: HupE/UreJ family protein, partial [Acidobacteriaceae bacterium]|nr:HupE/UreJ family protein [Acidobacteriaceae bacterium]
SKQCSDGKDNFVCTAVYQFPQPVDELDAECTFASVTVPNHIHLLRAYRGDKTDQAVFDISFTTAELRFRPPSALEVFVKESSAGFLRAVGGVAPLLFLVAMALAARSVFELGWLVLSFTCGELIACWLAPHFRVYLSPRFIEAAAALTIAYLAFEIMLLPRSGQRSLVVGVLGCFHGAYFSLFLDRTGYRIPGFLSGVVLGEVIALALIYFGLTRILRVNRIPKAIPVLAMALLSVGLAWFAFRVWA